MHMNQQVFEAIFFIGVLAAAAAQLWMVGLAWSRSVLWGLANMFVPFAVLLFAILHWDKAKWPLLLYVSAGVITCGTIAMYPDNMMKFAKTKHTISFGKSPREEMAEAVQKDSEKLADYLVHHDISDPATLTFTRELFSKTSWLDGKEFAKDLALTDLAKAYDIACLDGLAFGHKRETELLEITEKKADGKTLEVFMSLGRVQDVFVRPSASSQMQGLAAAIKQKGLAGSNDTVQACDKAFQKVCYATPTEVENALQAQLGDQYKVTEESTNSFKKGIKRTGFLCIRVSKKGEPYAFDILLNEGGAMIDFDFPHI